MPNSYLICDKIKILALQKFFKTTSDLSIGIWKIEEDESFFRKNLVLLQSEITELAELSSKKRVEWLASRYLLHVSLGQEDRFACVKDEHGKPYLQDFDQYISLSHSRNYVATIHGLLPCGIDIQYHIDKIGMIAKKFVSEDEKKFIPKDKELLYLHAIWGTKEAVYKAFGKKGTSLINNIHLDPFKIEEELPTAIWATLNIENTTKKYECKHEIFEDFTLVYVYEIM